MQGQVYIDGQFYDAEHAEISVFDRGLLIGDGIFEDIRVYEGKPFNIGKQLERLEQQASSIQLRMPLQREPLVGVIHELLRRNQIADGGVRLIVTRGPVPSKDSTHDPKEKGENGFRRKNGDARQVTPATLMIMAAELDTFSRELSPAGIDITVFGAREDETSVPLSTVKWLRQTERVAAYNKITRAGFPEALTVDQDGWITGALYHVVFAVQSGSLLIPNANGFHLGDTFRDIVIHLAKNLGVDTRETKLCVDDVLRADECFLSGFVTEIVPVKTIDGVTVGADIPGKMTALLSRQWENVIRDPSGGPVKPDNE